jgi:hypothetical protein
MTPAVKIDEIKWALAWAAWLRAAEVGDWRSLVEDVADAMGCAVEARTARHELESVASAGPPDAS